MSKILQLLEEGCDVNELNDSMGTPLNLAIRYKWPYIIKLLLVYDANPNAIHVLKSGKSWHILDDFYSSMRYNKLSLETLNLLFLYGANPYLAEDKTQCYFKPHFWKFVKQRAFDLVTSLSHLTAPELIAILEQTCPGAENISHHKKWNLVVTKHRFDQTKLDH